MHPLGGCDHPHRPEDRLCVDCVRRVTAGTARMDLCPACFFAMEKTSGGKMQCRACGFLLTCCDTV
jgi:hypothetical protein